jgi:osmotically-inducible protein OsmY
LTSVEVETNSGTVYLSGVVPSLAARERAVKLAWEVKGVQTVINHLEVEK